MPKCGWANPFPRRSSPCPRTLMTRNGRPPRMPAPSPASMCYASSTNPPRLRWRMVWIKRMTNKSRSTTWAVVRSISQSSRLAISFSRLKPPTATLISVVMTGIMPSLTGWWRNLRTTPASISKANPMPCSASKKRPRRRRSLCPVHKHTR